MIFIEPKEFGQEIYFRTSPDSNSDVPKPKRDPAIPNRYWFDLPGNWSEQRKTDPVIGIGEIYFNQCIRSIKYRVTLELVDPTLGMMAPVPEYTISVYEYCHMSRGDTFRKFITVFIMRWNEAIAAKNKELAAYKVGETPRPLTPYKAFDVFIKSNYEKVGTDTVTYIAFDCLEDPNRWNEIIMPSTGLTKTLIPYLTVELLSDDAIEVLNGRKSVTTTYALNGIDTSVYPVDPEEEPEDLTKKECDYIKRPETLRVYPAWDRNNVFVTSSLSSMTNESFLGYSRSEPLHRMKYYKVDNSTRRIWVELWSARNNKVRSILPEDGEDYLAIEGVVWFDASKALK